MNCLIAIVHRVKYLTNQIEAIGRRKAPFDIPFRFQQTTTYSSQGFHFSLIFDILQNFNVLLPIHISSASTTAPIKSCRETTFELYCSAPCISFRFFFSNIIFKKFYKKKINPSFIKLRHLCSTFRRFRIRHMLSYGVLNILNKIY